MLVYISATLLDLRPYRLAVERALLQLGHQPLGMESYVAEDNQPLEVCLRDVRRSELYIGIFAWRYGSEASADALPEEFHDLPKNASVTEYEFTYALQLQKPRLLFLSAEDEAWLPGFIDAFTGAGDNGHKIKELRSKALQSQVAFFRTPEDLAAGVSAAVSRRELSVRVREDALGENHDFQAALRGVPGAPLVQITTQRPRSKGATPSENAPTLVTGDTRLVAIKTAITECQPGGVIQVDLQPGVWWVTRLYLLAALAAHFADDQQLLFRDESLRFLGLASARAARECLATLHPALVDFDRSLSTMSLPPNLDSAVERVLESWESVMSKQGGELSIGGAVRRQDVRKWLGERLQTRHIVLTDLQSTDRGMQRLLEWPTRFVPVEQNSDLFVADRGVLAEHIAALALKELSARPPA